MPETERTGPHHRARPATPSAAIMTRPGDGIRARRLRKFATRHLDELLGQVDPWDFSRPMIDYHETYLDRGVREREFAGQELAEAGWAP